MGNPTVTPLVELRHEGGYVVWDPSDGMLTREAIVLASGAGVCTAGLVLGALLTGGAGVATAIGTNTGNGAMGAITVGSSAKLGDYDLEIVEPAANAGAFVVRDPDHNLVGHGTVGVAFNGGGLGFTLADGATDFVAGDTFKITVTGALKYQAYDPTVTTGLERAAAILWSGRRDATSADRRAVANVRGPMKVQAAELIWGANVTTQQHQTTALAQLAKLGILNV
ncbi:head decoration protein [Flavisphingomonas formosensis]|uniref:head decoration protein n=1 Tax=Flavisphingomonas formosensis TaxID=861534 RepID=UPI0012FA3E40|nr:head decoration protein [Sphingomonas formosensis]